MIEQWERWKPAEELAERYYIAFILDSMDCFKVELCDSKGDSPKVLVIFDNGIHAYRNTEETFRTQTFSYLSKNYENDFYSKWTFFRVTKNSLYLQWLSEQSHTISDSYDVLHFALITTDSILDIASTSEPRIEFIRSA